MKKDQLGEEDLYHARCRLQNAFIDMVAAFETFDQYGDQLVDLEKRSKTYAERLAAYLSVRDLL